MLDDNHWSKRRPLHMMIGLSISLSLVLMAFEWKFYDVAQVTPLTGGYEDVDTVMFIPPTKFKTPPKPQVKTVEFKTVTDEAEIDEIKVAFDDYIEDDVIDEPIEWEDEPDEELVETIFDIVAESAEPYEGMNAFLRGIGKKIKYPSQARKMGIEGTVHVQFVIEKDGSLTQVKVIRGIGGGCDQEAIRVVSMSKAWKPGHNRGRPVRQRMVLPIKFLLN